jgi:hypothetical protein
VITRIFLALSCCVPLFAALAINPAGAAQRTFVASYGSDAYADGFYVCGFATPCRTFAAALYQTDDGGEVLALDAADYGPVGINKSVSIVANPGVHAEIGVTDSIGVVAGSGFSTRIVLRGLHIYPASLANKPAGVVARAGVSLSIENCVISGFSATSSPSFDSGAGISVPFGARVFIADSTIRGNNSGVLVNGGKIDMVNTVLYENGNGIDLIGAYGSPSAAAVTESVASQNGAGFRARSNHTGSPCGAGYCGAPGGNARLTVTLSAASNNGRGMFLDGDQNTADIRAAAGYNTFTENQIGMGWAVAPMGFGVSLFSAGNNVVQLNSTNISGAITPVPLK